MINLKFPVELNYSIPFIIIIKENIILLFPVQSRKCSENQWLTL
jgi:hypothetical protein